MEDELPFEFNYEREEVNKVRRAVFCMRSRKAPGLTNVSVDIIKAWWKLSHAKKGEPDLYCLKLWEKVVELIQKCWEGEIPKAFSLGVLVIIPKDDKGGVRGIGLLEAIHKIISQIINIRLGDTIVFCEEVHGF